MSELVTQDEALNSLVTKEEALKLVNQHINKAPSVMDLPVFMELLTWQTRLTLPSWLEQRQQQRRQTPSGGSRLGGIVVGNPTDFINSLRN